MNCVAEFETNEICGHYCFMEYFNLKLMNKNDEDDNKSQVSRRSENKGKAINIKRKHYAIAKENTQYMALSFTILEELINSDNTILFKINEHVKQQKTMVTPQDEDLSKNIIKTFNMSEKNGIIILLDDSIYKMNNTLYENIQELENNTISDFKKILFKNDQKT